MYHEDNRPVSPDLPACPGLRHAGQLVSQQPRGRAQGEDVFPHVQLSQQVTEGRGETLAERGRRKRKKTSRQKKKGKKEDGRQKEREREKTSRQKEDSYY